MPSPMRTALLHAGFTIFIGSIRRSAYGRPRPARRPVARKANRNASWCTLSVDEVAHFWSSFRTSRDLAIVGLMLLQGLRLREVIALNCEDVILPESQIRIRGKGNKIRVLPLASGTLLLLDQYMRLERPARMRHGPCSSHCRDRPADCA